MENTKNNNQWFVILWEQECELLQSASEETVYCAIKSYCQNGKGQKDLSDRDIAKRAKLSKSNIKGHLENLINRGLVVIVGEKTRVGGTVPIYYCPIAEKLSVLYQDSRSQKSVPMQSESVPPQNESVPTSASKLQQSNKGKVKEETTALFSASDLSVLASRLRLSIADVQHVLQKLTLYAKDHTEQGKKYPVTLAKLEKWLVEDIQTNKLKPQLTLAERIEAENPDISNIAERIAGL